MRKLEGEQVLCRIFIGESDRHHHQPLYAALLERLHQEGFAGATVFRGIAGFGARSVVHTRALLELSTELPIVLEVVDGEDRVPRLREILDELVTSGCLVTMEKVQVLRYSA